MSQSRGIDIKRANDGSLIFLCLFLDSDNAKVTSGTTSVRIWHVTPATGALEAYDFNDNTFKTGALTTPTATATHRQVNNNTYDTGIWTYRHATLTDFTDEDQYLVEFANSIATPPASPRWFQYGGVEGAAAESGDQMDLVDELNEAAIAAIQSGLSTLAAGAEMDLVDEPNETALDAIASVISALLTLLHGSGSWRTGTAIGIGGGLYTVTLTQKDQSENPVTSVLCVVRNFAESAIVAIGLTDVNGQVELQLDDSEEDEPYKVRYGYLASGSGYDFGDQPHDLIVSGNTEQDYTCTALSGVAAGLSYAELKGSLDMLVTRAWPDQKRFVTPALIAQWINGAYQEIERKLRWSRGTYSFDTVADRSGYDIPSSVREYLQVQLTDAEGHIWLLSELSDRQLIEKRSGSTATKRPVYYLRHGADFELYPTPDTDGETVKIWAVLEPGNLSGDDDKPGFPAHLHELIIDLALAYACRQFGEFERATQLQAVVEQELIRERTEPAVNRGGPDRVSRRGI